MITIQAQNLTEETALVRLSLPVLTEALGELGIPHPITAGMFIAQWYFRVFLAGQGVRLNNGKTYIYDGYQEWAEKFPTVSKWQFGRIIRALCAHGLIEKGCFAHLKYLFPSKKKNPLWHLCHEDNKRSFIHVVHDRIVELIGFDPRKVFKNYKDPLKPSPQAKVQNFTESCEVPHQAKCRTAPCTMYQDHSRNLQISPEAREKKNSVEYKYSEVDREEELSHSSSNVNGKDENLQQSLDENNYSSDLAKRSAPRRNKSSQKSSQNDTFQGWPSGPWLNDAGQLNGDFVDWVTTKFMKDPRRGSDDFYGTQVKVLRYFRSNDTAIQDNWLIYHKQHLHLLATAMITESSGGTNTDKTLNELAKAKPAICNPGPQDISYRAPASVHEYVPALASAAETAVNSNSPLSLLHAGSIEAAMAGQLEEAVEEAAEEAAVAGQLEEAVEEAVVAEQLEEAVEEAAEEAAVAGQLEEAVEIPAEQTPVDETDYPAIEDPWLDSDNSVELLEVEPLEIEKPSEQEEAVPTNQTTNQKESVSPQELVAKLGCLINMWKANDVCRRIVKNSVAKSKWFILTDDGPAFAPEFQTD